MYKNDSKALPVFEDGLFTPYTLDFIHYKRSCGIKYEDSAPYVLRMICHQMNQYPADGLEMTKEMVKALVEKHPAEAYSTQSRRISYLRQLAIYLNMRGIPAYVYPENSIHKEEKTFVPYLFTQNEVKTIFQVADNLPCIKRYPNYEKVYPVLLRLLFSSGLRISEALNLKIKHFSYADALLLIENAKNGKSRCIPLSASMSHVLIEYLDCRYGIAPARERFIFEAPDGGRYNRGGVRSTIMNIFKNAGLPTISDEYHPRVHDARHQFAVSAMEKMKAEGMDLYCAMPLLSVYLGHKGLRETEKYLWLPQFCMEEIAVSDQKLVAGMIPEVSWDEE
ncbi:MAG: tyrosine-type recombinase/integrase [Lachnospiraceae bacterium]